MYLTGGDGAVVDLTGDDDDDDGEGGADDGLVGGWLPPRDVLPVAWPTLLCSDGRGASGGFLQRVSIRDPALQSASSRRREPLRRPTTHPMPYHVPPPPPPRNRMRYPSIAGDGAAGGGPALTGTGFYFADAYERTPRGTKRERDVDSPAAAAGGDGDGDGDGVGDGAADCPTSASAPTTFSAAAASVSKPTRVKVAPRASAWSLRFRWPRSTSPSGASPTPST